MSRFAARWAALFDEREPGTSLALFRIACGLCIVYSIGDVVMHGLAPVIWLNPADGGYSYVGDPPRLLQLLGRIPGLHALGQLNPSTLWALIAVTLFAAVLLVLGLGGRVTTLLALLGYQAVYSINLDTLGGYDWLLTNALWLLFLARSTATLSLDCRLRTGRWTSPALIPAWPRYLAIYQIVLVYWSTGMHKVSGAWTPSEGFCALYYILQEPTWQRFDMRWLAWVYPLTQVATAVTWLWEITSPLLLLALWYRRTAERPGRLRAFSNRLPLRGLWVATGLAVHLGILVFMNVGPFSLVSLSYYLCLFTPREWEALAVPLVEARTA